ncbi:MAG: hypothetical protein ABIS86_09900 [Streptosporangiaceae bacterium]
MTPALARPLRSGTPAVAGRLLHEFAALAPDQIDRCVTDVRACVAHLGVEPTPALVERIAREHLTGMVKSEPPSGRDQDRHS